MMLDDAVVRLKQSKSHHNNDHITSSPGQKAPVKHLTDWQKAETVVI